MDFSIWRITKESYCSLWENFIPWLIVSSLPLAFLIGVELLYVILGSIYSPSVEGVAQLESFMPQARENLTFIDNTFLRILFLIIGVVVGIIANLIWVINGYRYTLLGEGGKNLFFAPGGKRLLRTILYTILYVLIILAYFGFCAGIMFFILPAVDSVVLNIVFGVAAVIFGIYLFTKLIFIYPGVATDQKNVIRDTWKTTSGHVLKLFGLFLVVTISIVIFFGISLLLIMFFRLFGEIIGTFIGTIISYAYTFLATVIFIQAISLAYKTLKKK